MKIIVTAVIPFLDMIDPKQTLEMVKTMAEIQTIIAVARWNLRVEHGHIDEVCFDEAMEHPFATVNQLMENYFAQLRESDKSIEQLVNKSIARG